MTRMILSSVILASFFYLATREHKIEPTYRDGFIEGYGAYMSQCGKYIPIPPVPRNKEGYQDGYQDGYHTAIKFENCPY